jgi:predicted signal transduction protein with EAL and GGDEF domain
VLGAVALGLVIVRLGLSLRENAGLFATIQRAALHDPLTGLANRRLLLDRLEQGLARRSRRGGVTGVLFVDLDDFKAINDAHGHDMGDEVLVAVGERLRDVLRAEDTVARSSADETSPQPRDTIGRLGGDEFVVLLEDLKDPAAVAVVAERILARVRVPLVLGGHELSLDASVGITLSSADRSPTEVLRDADTAMYAAKRAGKGRYQLFQTVMHEEVVARTELIRDLRAAVADGQLRVLYQPQVDLASGRLTGVEALVRWEHPERGLLTPDRFLPEAESAGIIVAIDDWVMREACAQLREWDLAGLAPLQMAVNVSMRRLVSRDLAGNVATVLRGTHLAPERLEVEITEATAVEHDCDAVAAIRSVRDLGVRVAIDDFGMGHSALSRLQSFPVDRLKIDRTFIAPLTSHGARGSIADAMIAIAQSLGLEVVAEGVETREHLHALRALGCASGQGYLFSKPVPADTIEHYAQTGLALSPAADQPVAADAFDFEPSPANHERLTRTLLAELQRVTGLETTYLTRIDWDDTLQHITHARNTGTIDIPEGLTVDWSNTLCRQALEEGITYTDDVRTTFADSQAAEELGLQTYLSVPLVDDDGAIQGTLCGASSKRVSLGPEAIQVMERFGEIITQGIGVTREPQNVPRALPDVPLGREAEAVGRHETLSRQARP